MHMENSYEHQLNIIKNSNIPIFVHGTLRLGQAAERLCHALQKPIQAFVDNDERKQGRHLLGKPILSMQEVLGSYSKAIIILCVTMPETAEKLSRQYMEKRPSYLLLGSGMAEYFFETLCHSRALANPERLLPLIEDRSLNDGTSCRTNKKVLKNYIHCAGTEAAAVLDDIQNLTQQIQGIREVFLFLDSGNIKESLVELLEQLSLLDKVLHISFLLNAVTPPDKTILKLLGKYLYGIQLEGRTRELICEWKAAADECNLICETSYTPYSYELNRDWIPDCEIITERKWYRMLSRYLDIPRPEGEEKPVFFVQIGYGLGNQILSFLFGKLLEEKSGRKVIFDDTANALNSDKASLGDFYRKLYPDWSDEKLESVIETAYYSDSNFRFSGLELAEILDVPIHLLSSSLTNEQWNMLIKKLRTDIPSYYKWPVSAGYLMSRYQVGYTLIGDNVPVGFYDNQSQLVLNFNCLTNIPQDYSVAKFLYSFQKNAYFAGVWDLGLQDDLFMECREWIHSKLKFKEMNDTQNREMADGIKNSNSVVIHIRVNDKVKDKSGQADFIHKCVCRIKDLTEYPNKKFFIFSDNIAWCKEHKKLLGFDFIQENLIYVTHNRDKNSFRDLQLMALGKILVPSYQSTFSYCALLLSETVEKYVDVSGYFSKLSCGYCKDEIPVNLIDVTK